MTTLEILLLILGAVIFLASFIVPESKGEIEMIDKQLSQEQLQEMLKDEIKNIRSQVEDTVEETVNYSMEKTERALERLTNEKITAVSEYTDTVMSDIHKSHEEVMFLYDMLNNKHENLKETASEVSQTVKEVNTAVSEAELTKQEVTQATQKLDEALQNAAVIEKVEFDPIDLSGLERLKQTGTVDPFDNKDATLDVNNIKIIENSVQQNKSAKELNTINTTRNKSKQANNKSKGTESGSAKTTASNTKISDKSSGKTARNKSNSKKKELENVAIQFTSDQMDGMNNNDRILYLHKQGKSNIAIAKELGLGVGEVKLVIDLFKGI